MSNSYSIRNRQRIYFLTYFKYPTVVSDIKIPVNAGNGTISHYTADIKSAQDYYPFGMIMPGRNFNTSTYRFGFNGQEKDDEITGQTGSHTTALFWEYDTRIGRRWNLDPKPQISISDYAVMGNNPIWFNDPLGDKWKDNDKDQETADNMKIGFDKQQKSYENNAKKAYLNYEMHLANGEEKLASESYKTWEKNIAAAGDMFQAKKELDALRDDSKNTFTFKQTKNNIGQFYSENGIYVIEHTGSFSNKAHESKHAYQILEGQTKPTIQREQQAYTRQFNTSKLSMPKSENLFPKKPNDITFDYLKGIKDDQNQSLYNNLPEYQRIPLIIK